MDIYSFSSEVFTQDEDVLDVLGYRGRRLMHLSSLGIPILPGFILTNDSLLAELDSPGTNNSAVQKSIKNMEDVVGKKFGDPDNPLLVKYVLSPQLNMIDTFSSLHNVGLCGSTIDGFASFVGEEFAYHEYRNMLRRVVTLDLEVETDVNRRKLLEKKIDSLKSCTNAEQTKSTLVELEGLYPQEIFADSWAQLEFIQVLYTKYLKESESINDSSLLVQAMTFGNYGKKSYFGSFFTRDIVNGENKLDGQYFLNSFDATSSDGKGIDTISKDIYKDLNSIARLLENHYKEIRQVKFTVEDGKLWVIDQQEADGKSTQAHIRTLLELNEMGVVKDEYLINDIQPTRLAEILHPVIDRKSAQNLPSSRGGISGSVGAAVGRVFFSTDELMKEYRIATQRGLESDFILIMKSTYAEDVKAIEVCKGVITIEGGYASHAPVVARSLGKVAMVKPELKLLKSSVKIGDITIKEGDYITMDVTSYDKPTIYFGKVDLIKPSIEESGILEYLNIVQKFIGDFDVHANADQPKDAQLARLFLADGIGLCRTEHMFFDEERIPLFRSLIITDDMSDRHKILDKLGQMQTSDFYNLFKIMEGHPVTIRLLDAPLHEFLPHTRDSMQEFVAFYRKDHPKVTEAEIRLRCDMMGEVNPMLGHRGIRVAISKPEVYAMQIRSIFEAIYKLKVEDGIDSRPEIMLPVVMSHREVKTVRFGKRIEGAEILGIRDIEEAVRQKYDIDALPYQVGTMIELPGAALNADKIARYADFFSFGTNDLTQTTNGISRDDFNSFFTDYNEYDLLERNPFKYLNGPVKELVQIAKERGRMVRPNMKMGLCGEHGAEPENVSFCMDTGLNYVSCSPYGIPIAKLAVAQYNLKNKK
ncbi:pyruvate, phosphate dikinase [Oceanispirochaeta crateris]|uniref:Pyruvate, phosphate dikinase n=1 Tax=Oceanispirochaeta crateris TaxID=2518645 RepID=A0A5C1QI56_9SPIO|nr:putative PEP-binding protein [Oceanispirochaeta crateris]QEN07823.1 pyruvate, phosphate dikinase [Oceanispirochaeta crateris]